MKAFIVKRYGKKEKLLLTEVAEPIVKENEVLVQVYAAGVNQLDSKIRNGEFKLILPYKAPFRRRRNICHSVGETLGSYCGDNNKCKQYLVSKKFRC